MNLEKIDKERMNRIFLGEGTKEDEQFLTGLFHDESLSDEIKCQMKRQWDELSAQESLPEKSLDHILYKLNYDINTENSRSEKPGLGFIKRAAGIAAAVLFMISLCTAIYYKTRTEYFNKTWTEIKAPAWTQASFTLPDSSKVWLNSRSSLKYRGDYLSDRKVTLVGEAYFDVRSDKKHPFTVEADNLIIKALGTRFNVASYADEKNMEIVLEEGGLVINDTESERSVNVTPNKLITYDKEQDELMTTCVRTNSYVSWKEGKLVFRNDPMDVIARRLGRWYNVDIDIKGENSDQLRLRATFIDDNLEEVLYFLEQSLTIRCKVIEGGLGPNDTYLKKKVEIILK